jgi:hypothetical protein
LWLDRTTESFAPGYQNASDARFRLPRISQNQILQFDLLALHAALNARREARGVTCLRSRVRSAASRAEC